MNTKALLHQSRSYFCFPVSDHEMVVRLRTAKGDAEDVMILFAENKFEWMTERRKVRMEKRCSTIDFDWYEAKLLLNGDTRLGYVFEIRSEGRRWYYCEEGVDATYEFDLAFFNYFQFPFLHADDILDEVPWTRGAVAYQIYPDRFAEGTRGKDRAYVNLAWGDMPYPHSFAGGDLWGVQEKLGYLADLGVTVLYLTSVFASPGGRKNDCADFYQVDPALGGNEALLALTGAAHARGMRVVLDAAFGHCSDRHPFFRDVCEKGRDSEYYPWFYVTGGRVDTNVPNYRYFASNPAMPKMNTENGAVIDYACAAGAYWLTEYGVDGYRLTAADELSGTFLRRFRQSVKAAKPDALLLGEIWHESHPWLQGDQLDGVTNYGLTKACADFFGTERISEARFADRLVRLFIRNTDAANQMLLNQLDCCDMERFQFRLSENLERLQSAWALLFFCPGIPCLFYGDEIGLSGGYDPDNCRCFPWDEHKWDYGMHAHLRRLATLRQRPALISGSFSADVTKEGLVRVVRTADADRMALYLNRTGEVRRLYANGRMVILPADGFYIDEDFGG